MYSLMFINNSCWMHSMPYSSELDTMYIEKCRHVASHIVAHIPVISHAYNLFMYAHTHTHLRLHSHSGVTFSESWNTSSELDTELTFEPKSVSGLKLTLSSSFLPSSGWVRGGWRDGWGGSVKSVVTMMVYCRWRRGVLWEVWWCGNM